MVLPDQKPKSPYGVPEVIRTSTCVGDPRHGSGCRCLLNKKKVEELKQAKQVKKEEKKEKGEIKRKVED